MATTVRNKFSWMVSIRNRLNAKVCKQRIEYLITKIFIVDLFTIGAGKQKITRGIKQTVDNAADLGSNGNSSVSAGRSLEAANKKFYAILDAKRILFQTKHFIGTETKIAKAVNVVSIRIFADLLANHFNLSGSQ